MGHNNHISYWGCDAVLTGKHTKKERSLESDDSYTWDTMHAASISLKLWGLLSAGSWFAGSDLLGRNSASTDFL